MEEVFIGIMERIAELIPELSYIDEDYGQLETAAENDSYPVTYPCVLIGETESAWSDVGSSYQKGNSSVTVKLAMDCYDDTHYSSGSYVKVRDRLAMAGRVYEALQGLKCSGNATPLTRIRSSGYTIPGLIKVYETTFSFRLVEKW
ncbi:hypothetical protein [uncultured Duncaniella sp.]|uniref:hypothetical protein n=1 Tax=uncultured Duncaniella sp. TaxID=2768039 RepID=UPI0025A98E61|nr:hypothetical protein [uncultured Duncaniella sp.]